MNNVGYRHAVNSDEKWLAVNALEETSSIILVVQKHRKAILLKRMSKLSLSRLLSFIEKNTSVKISEDALPQYRKRYLEESSCKCEEGEVN